MTSRLEIFYAGLLLLVVVSATVFVFNRFHMTTDLGAFLPKGESRVDSLMVDLLDKGATSNLMFIGIRSNNTEQIVAANQALAQRFSDSNHILAVHNSPQGLTQPQQQLIQQYRYLLSDRLATQTMTEQGLNAALEQRMQGLTSPLASLEKRFIRFDPTGEILHIMQQIISQDKDKSSASRLIDGTWLAQSGQRGLMILELNATAFDLDGLSDAYEFITKQMEALKQQYQVEFDITGPGAFAVYSRDVIRDDVKLLSIMATTGVGFFLLLALRSLPMLLMVFVPLACGIISAIAAILLVFGKINGITLAFGVTLIGVAIDYPIHFFTHLKNGKNDPSQSSLKLIWPTLRLGVFSTVIAYGSLLFAEMRGLQQLGLFTITGLLVAATTTRWILPLILPHKLPSNKGLSGLHDALERVALPAYKIRWLVLAATIAALVYLLLIDRTIADYNTRSLSPISKSQTALDREIRAELGHWSGGNLFLVTGDNDQQVLERLEALEPFLRELINQHKISDYASVASFLPSVERQTQRREALPDENILVANLNQALEGFPFKKGLFDQFIADVKQSKLLEPITISRLKEYDLDEKASALLHQKDDQWYAPILLYRVVSEQVIADELDSAYPDQDWISFISLQHQSNKIMENALNNMIKLITIGGFCIYLLLAISFRDFIRPFKIILPTLMAVGLTVFTLAFSGIALNVFHIVSLLLVVGLGLDYSLFFHRLTDHKDEWSSTFRALWMCCFSTVLVFGMLIISKTPPLHAVGLTVAIGAFLCLILGAIFASRSLRHPEET